MENQVNTLPVDKTPEQIEREMNQTRESLTEKVAALENQVVGTVQDAANTLTDTVDAVKSFVNTAPEAVSDTVEQVAEAVSEQVKKTFDISGHVQANPWTAVGVSVGVGFLTGLLVFRGQNSSVPRPVASMPAMASPPFAAPREPGLFDDLLGMVGRKVKEAAEHVIDSATASVTKNVQESIPKLIDGAAKRFIPDMELSREPGYNAGARI